MLFAYRKSNIPPTFISEPLLLKIPSLNVFQVDSSGDKRVERPDSANHNQQQKILGLEGPLSHFVPFSSKGLKTAPPITAVIKPIQPPVKIKRRRKKIQWDAINKSKEKLIRESSASHKNETLSDICKTYVDEPLLINPMNVPDPCVEDREPLTGKKYENPQLVNHQLSNLGLDGANSYIIPFDLDTVVQNRAQADTIIDSMKTGATVPPTKAPETTVPVKVKRSVENTNHWVVSEQYRKLVDTVESLRKKRENEERIGKLFSRQNEEDKLASVKSRNRELQNLSKVKFEKPLVFSIEN